MDAILIEGEGTGLSQNDQSSRSAPARPALGADEIGDALSSWNRGERAARDRVFDLLYDELHALAVKHMRKQARRHTLQPTELISKAYLRICSPRRDGQERSFRDRGHFMRLASRVMRTVLVDHARAKKTRKRALGGERLPLEIVCDAYCEQGHDVLELHVALEKLEVVDPQAAQVMEMHFFGGRTTAEIAEALDISERTAQRDLEYAMAWLAKYLRRT